MVFPVWHVKAHHKRNWWKRHSLSLVAGFMVLLWTVLYYFGDQNKHSGSFYGNAIADWTGVFVMVLITKWFYEVGSEESRKCPRAPVHKFLVEHSLSIFLLVTGAMWIYAFLHMDPNGKWGQVVGNIVSEWTQVLGTVLMTKWFIEVGSKESKH